MSALHTTDSPAPFLLVRKDDPRRDHYLRIAGTFFAYPDLRITLAEAQQLWRLDASTCQARLNELLAARFLACEGAHYQLKSDGD